METSNQIKLPEINIKSPKSSPDKLVSKSFIESDLVTPVLRKQKVSISQFRQIMKPISTLRTPLNAANKFILPDCDNKMNKTFQSPVKTVGVRGTLEISDRFHDRADPNSQVNQARRSYDIAPNSQNNDMYNTIRHQMEKNQTKAIIGPMSKKYKVSDQSFSETGRGINKMLDSPDSNLRLSKNQQSTTEWYKDANKMQEIDQQKLNGQYNQTTTKKPLKVITTKGGTSNIQQQKDQSKFSELKFKQSK